MVCAGAGAGKTHALVYHYLLAVLGFETPKSRPVAPSRVVAVTFTENAACEMRERVASTLMDLMQKRCDNPLQRQLVKRAQQLHVAMPKRDTLQSLWESVQQAPICTFHSLCASLLRRHGEPVGVHPHFTLLDELQQQQLLQQCCTGVVLPALQGKNSALHQLVARLGLQDIAGRRGVISLFCALYQQMQEHGLQPRYASLACAVGAQQGQHCIAQVEQALVQLQQQHVKQVQDAWNVLRGLVMGDETQLQAKQSEVGLAFEHCMQQLSGLGRSGSVRTCKQMLQQLGNWLCNVVVLPQQKAVRHALQQLHEQSLEHKLQAQTLGFSDLLQLAVTLLRQHSDVRVRVQQQFDKLLVDECQDTNALQADLVILLAQSRNDNRTPLTDTRVLEQLPLQPGMLFIVGDPKQSIYGFRGADARLFGQLSDKISQEALGRREHLPICRRCQGSIVEFVNMVAEATLPIGEDGVPFALEDRLQVFQATKHSTREQSSEKAKPPCGPVKHDEEGRSDKSTKPPCGPLCGLWQVQLQKGQDANETMHKALVGQVRGLLQQKEVTPADVVILVRRQRIGQQIQKQMQHVGIPTYLVGGDPFFFASRGGRYSGCFTLVAAPVG